MAEDSDNGWMGIVGAGLLTGLLGSQGQKDTNETNIQLGREQMQFQERMSGTAYQRAVKDMQTAGINPMLAANVGGATTPSGAMPQVQNRVGAGVASAAQSITAMQAAQQIQNSKAQEDEMRTNIEKIKSETMDRNLNTAVRAAQVAKDEATARSATEQARKTSEEILGARYDSQGKQMTYRANRGDEELKGSGWAADVDKRKAEARSKALGLSEDESRSKFWKSDWGHAEPYIQSATGVARGVSSAVQAAKPPFRKH